MKRLLLCVTLVTLVIMATGCPGKKGPKEVDIMKLIREMVTAFFLRDYDGAKEKADVILAREPNRTEAYAVLGLIYMAQDSLGKAEAQFDSALVEGREGDKDHAVVGRAMLYRELDYLAAIENGQIVLDRTPDYKLPTDEMAVDPEPPFVLTDNHIRLLVAQCHWLVGQFLQAQATASTIPPSITRPSNIRNLDPDNSATWVVGGVAYKSYKAALGVALQALDASVTPEYEVTSEVLE